MTATSAISEINGLMTKLETEHASLGDNDPEPRTSKTNYHD